MFFNLCHDRLPVPILIVVPSNGRPFLRAMDVIRILGRENLRRPGEKRAALRVRDVIHRKMDLPRSALKTRIFSVEKTLDLLRDCGEISARMIRFWFRNPEGPKVYPDGPVRPCVDRRKAQDVKIGVEDCRNAPSFEEFLDEFARATAEMYKTAARDFAAKNLEIRLRNDSLESMNLPEPPESLLVRFGEQVFEYKLS